MEEMAKKIDAENAYQEKPSHIPTIQSANTLFHFVKEKEFLFSIIKNFALTPRYCIEDIAYLGINMKKIAYPMLCFCDINLHKMQDHIDFYGGYGIAFSKNWGITKGIQPIQYINEQSLLREDFTEAFLKSMDLSTADAGRNYLLTHMYFLKPIEGHMEMPDGTIKVKNFTDECEWRYIPDVKILKLPQAVKEININSKSISNLNKTLAFTDTCWLKFDPPEIKYIIVKTEEDCEQLLDIIEDKGLEKKVRNSLISKIIIWDNAKGDF